jgi:hypothetical protein
VIHASNFPTRPRKPHGKDVQEKVRMELAADSRGGTEVEVRPAKDLSLPKFEIMINHRTFNGRSG